MVIIGIGINFKFLKNDNRGKVCFWRVFLDGNFVGYCFLYWFKY